MKFLVSISYILDSNIVKFEIRDWNIEITDYFYFKFALFFASDFNISKIPSVFPFLSDMNGP